MDKKKIEVVCKRCDKGVTFLAPRQLETGVTTKKIERVKCHCCKGKWWDCMQCYIEKEYGLES